MLQQEQQNSNNYFSVESLLRYSKIDEGLLNKPIAEKDAHKVKYSGFEIFCHLVNAPILGCNNAHQLSQSRDTKALWRIHSLLALRSTNLYAKIC